MAVGLAAEHLAAALPVARSRIHHTIAIHQNLVRNPFRLDSEGMLPIQHHRAWYRA